MFSSNGLHALPRYEQFIINWVLRELKHVETETCNLVFELRDFLKNAKKLKKMFASFAFPEGWVLTNYWFLQETNRNTLNFSFSRIERFLVKNCITKVKGSVKQNIIVNEKTNSERPTLLTDYKLSYLTASFYRDNQQDVLIIHENKDYEILDHVAILRAILPQDFPQASIQKVDDKMIITASDSQILKEYVIFFKGIKYSNYRNVRSFRNLVFVDESSGQTLFLAVLNVSFSGTNPIPNYDIRFAPIETTESAAAVETTEPDTLVMTTEPVTLVVTTELAMTAETAAVTAETVETTATVETTEQYSTEY
jgi:hypothetical protein